MMIVNDVVDLAKKTGRECLILKVDFEKAYDSVGWGFIEYMLQRFGFCSKWIEWMGACIFAGNLSVFVSGNSMSKIDIKRGLNKEILLPLSISCLVAEGFSGVMRNAVSQNLFTWFPIAREGQQISHLQYADDTLCIGEATIQNL
jgi:hypothetical protein